MLVLFAGLFLASCKNTQLTTRHLKDHELLLKSNKIKIHNNKDISKSELKTYIRQKPNRSILFGAWKLKLQWKNLWKKPKNDDDRLAVILDTNLMEKSKKQLEIYLKNKGYYNAVIETKYKRTNALWLPFLPTKKARVYYDIYPGSPLKIDSANYSINQHELKKRYLNSKKSSLIKKGNNLDIPTLQAERERLAKVYQNFGFYDITDKYIVYDIDTTLGDNKCIVVTRVKDFSRKNKLHKQYFIHDIFVKIGDVKESSEGFTDTAEYNGIYFLSKGDPEFNPDPIYRSIFIKKDRYYSIDHYNDTYRRLANLQMFSFIKINYHKLSTDSLDNLMNVEILLNPSKKRSLSLELNGTYSIGFGFNSQIGYSQKNVFGNSEILEFKFGSGLEMLKSTETNEDILGSNIGPKLAIRFPRFFLMPKLLSNTIGEPLFPKTSLSAQYNYLKRADYARHFSNFFYKWEWNKGPFKKFELFPVDHNITFIDENSPILSDISSLSKAQQFRFENHIIFGLKASYLYNNEKSPSVRHPLNFKAKVFAYGLIPLFAKAFNAEVRNAEGAITMFGVRYASILKIETDIRKHFNLGKNNVIAMRWFSGASQPLDYGSVVPFDQLYFSGGPNGIRGWRQRRLGPGGYFKDGDELDKLGEIKLEANIEYRFPFSSLFRGAVFVDAGNIWGVNASAGEKSDFQLNRFYEEIAVAVGGGLRLDLSFFVLRLDYGIQTLKPYQNDWKLDLSKEGTTWHFGIGYPF